MWLDKLREMKNASELTTKEISFLSKIPEPTLEKIFAGATKDPKLETMRQLVHFFGYTLDDLEDKPLKKSLNTAETMPRELASKLERLYFLLQQLNGQGQEKLLDYANDLVASGRYIKSGQSNLGQKEA